MIDFLYNVMNLLLLFVWVFSHFWTALLRVIQLVYCVLLACVMQLHKTKYRSKEQSTQTHPTSLSIWVFCDQMKVRQTVSKIRLLLRANTLIGDQHHSRA